MEIKGIIERYHDAILPLSRRQVAEFLKDVKERETEITGVERSYLRDFLVEFEYEVSGMLVNTLSVIESTEPTLGATLSEVFSDREKYLYAYVDTNLSFFVNGLLTFDARRSTGDALGGENAGFVQFGGRIRGSIFDHLGYYLQATNAEFRGSRDVLERDKIISQSYELRALNASNFDFVEGYVRYGANIVSAQVGRERLFWGNGLGDRLVLSDNPRVFDFVRADAEYKSLKYTFVHAWILGTRSSLTFTLPSDTASTFVEPVVSDKYFAAHRLEFSFPSLFDLAAQEMVIYGNRSPDLAYLNPITLIESAQRSREERDNVFWAFDIQTHFIPRIQLQATFLWDDINLPDLFSDVWTDRWAYQAGVFAADPLGIPNTSVMVEYTRVEPYVFSHGRSRDGNYGSLGRILGHHIGPNSDSWFVRLDHIFNRKLIASARAELQREGENIKDAAGNLIRNVGGDFLQPHRSIDSPKKEFLGGNLVRTTRLEFVAAYEIVNEFFLDLWYKFERRENEDSDVTTSNHDFGIGLRVDI